MHTRDELDQHEAEELYGRLSAAAVRKARRRRRGRIVGAGVTAAVLVGAMAWAATSLSGLHDRPAAPPPVEPANYRFTDISVSTAGAVDPNLPLRWLVVAATPHWTTQEYPGWHDCTWTLTDAGGTTIADERASFASSTPGTAVEIATGRVGTAAPLPTSVQADVTCDEERLDSAERLAVSFAEGEANYEALDVEPSVVEGDAGLPAVAIAYRESWSGDTYPGVHECMWLARDADGAIVALQHGESASMLRQTRVHPIVTPLFGAPPASAEVRCDPLRLDTPAAYLISGERIVEGEDGRLEIAYDMAWPDDVQLPAYPSDNACAGGVRTPTGEVAVGEGFTFSAPPGTYREALPAVAWDGPTSDLRVIVRCIPWSDEGSVRQAMQLVASELGG